MHRSYRLSTMCIISILVLLSMPSAMCLTVTRQLQDSDIFKNEASCGKSLCSLVNAVVHDGGDNCECQCREQFPTYSDIKEMCVRQLDDCQDIVFENKPGTIETIILPSEGRTVNPTLALYSQGDISKSLRDNYTCSVKKTEYYKAESEVWIDIKRVVSGPGFGLTEDNGKIFLQWASADTSGFEELEGRLVKLTLSCQPSSGSQVSMCMAVKVLGTAGEPVPAGGLTTEQIVLIACGCTAFVIVLVGVIICACTIRRQMKESRPASVLSHDAFSFKQTQEFANLNGSVSSAATSRLLGSPVHRDAGHLISNGRRSYLNGDVPIWTSSPMKSKYKAHTVSGIDNTPYNVSQFYESWQHMQNRSNQTHIPKLLPGSYGPVLEPNNKQKTQGSVFKKIFTPSKKKRSYATFPRQAAMVEDDFENVDSDLFNSNPRNGHVNRAFVNTEHGLTITVPTASIKPMQNKNPIPTENKKIHHVPVHLGVNPDHGSLSLEKYTAFTKDGAAIKRKTSHLHSTVEVAVDFTSESETNTPKKDEMKYAVRSDLPVRSYPGNGMMVEVHTNNANNIPSRHKPSKVLVNGIDVPSQGCTSTKGHVGPATSIENVLSLPSDEVPVTSIDDILEDDTNHKTSPVRNDSKLPTPSNLTEVPNTNSTNAQKHKKGYLDVSQPPKVTTAGSTDIPVTLIDEIPQDREPTKVSSTPPASPKPSTSPVESHASSNKSDRSARPSVLTYQWKEVHADLNQEAKTRPSRYSLSTMVPVSEDEVIPSNQQLKVDGSKNSSQMPRSSVFVQKRIQQIEGKQTVEEPIYAKPMKRKNKETASVKDTPVVPNTASTPPEVVIIENDLYKSQNEELPSPSAKKVEDTSSNAIHPTSSQSPPQLLSTVNKPDQISSEDRPATPTADYSPELKSAKPANSKPDPSARDSTASNSSGDDTEFIDPKRPSFHKANILREIEERKNNLNSPIGVQEKETGSKSESPKLKGIMKPYNIPVNVDATHPNGQVEDEVMPSVPLPKQSPTLGKKRKPTKKKHGFFGGKKKSQKPSPPSKSGNGSKFDPKHADLIRRPNSASSMNGERPISNMSDRISRDNVSIESVGSSVSESVTPRTNSRLSQNEGSESESKTKKLSFGSVEIIPDDEDKNE